MFLGSIDLGGVGGDFLCRRNIMDEDVGFEEFV